MMNLLMIEQNMEKNEGSIDLVSLTCCFCSIFRHNIIELIETEKEYVKDLALIVEVYYVYMSIVFFLSSLINSF